MKKLTPWFSLLVLLASCSGNKAAGTYVLDKEPMLKKFEGMPAEMKKAFESMDVVATLNSDGTCSMTANMPSLPGIGGGEKQTSTGTYKVEGDQITITVLEENGKKRDKPDPKTGTLKDGVISVSEKGMELRLVKK